MRVKGLAFREEEEKKKEGIAVTMRVMADSTQRTRHVTPHWSVIVILQKETIVMCGTEVW